MTRREIPPFRADHVGSLLRTDALHSARARFANGEIAATSCAPRRTAASTTSSPCSVTSACRRRRTGSTDARPGTWTSSTSSPASAAPTSTTPGTGTSSRPKGGDPQHQHEQYIGTINDALRDRPDDTGVTTHLCRGNYRSSWAAEGSYDFVAEAVFSRLDVDAFCLEYDDEHSAGFEPLRFVPEDKLVVLGLVTTKAPKLEDKDELKRIGEAATYVPLDQLCLSPQCGFSSTVELNALTVDEEIARLRLVVETAREVWS